MAEEKKLRIVFLGTPDFAAVILKILVESQGGQVVGVFTQPDRPCGRGQVCQPSAVKKTALELDIPVFQPENFKTEENITLLKDLEPDILVVAAYGLILPQTVLDVAPMGAINVHASLLPRYRGAAPIHRAIVNGEAVTGITIMQMVRELDAGPVLLQRALGIGLYDTAQTIHDELAQLGGVLLVEALQRLTEGKLRPVEQEEDLATYAHKLEKSEGEIDWNRTALSIHNKIRGFYPWPGAYFDWKGPEGKTIRLTVFPGKLGPEIEDKIKPGTILGTRDDHIEIACRDRVYLIPRVKPAGGKELDGQAFQCGYLSRCV